MDFFFVWSFEDGFPFVWKQMETETESKTLCFGNNGNKKRFLCDVIIFNFLRVSFC